MNFLPKPEFIDFDLVCVGEVLREIRRVKGKTVTDFSCLKDFSGRIISIGDYVFLRMINENIKPDIAIIDMKIERKPVNLSIPPEYFVLKAENPPGRISKDAWNTILKGFKLSENRKVCIVIDGEEDLLGYTVAIFSKAGDVAVYGDPFRKVSVVVKITSNVKAKAAETLSKFKVEIG